MHSCKLVLDNTRLNKFPEGTNRALVELLYKTDESAAIRKERH